MTLLFVRDNVCLNLC